MSHTYKSDKGTHFHFNSDFSGTMSINNADGECIEIPAKCILEFVAYKYIMPEKIRKLEDMDYEELLDSFDKEREGG